MIVEDDADVGGGSGIRWQQSDLGEAVQQNQLLVAARPDSNQRRSAPRIHQTSARAAVQHNAVAVRGVDQAGRADSVFAHQHGRHAWAVPVDQFGHARVLVIDAPGHPVVGIGCDHPDLRSLASLRRHLARQPVTVRRVDDAFDRALYRQHHVT